MEVVSGLDRMSAEAVVTKQQQQQKQIINILFFYVCHVLKALHSSIIIYNFITLQSTCSH